MSHVAGEPIEGPASLNDVQVEFRTNIAFNLTSALEAYIQLFEHEIISYGEVYQHLNQRIREWFVGKAEEGSDSPTHWTRKAYAETDNNVKRLMENYDQGAFGGPATLTNIEGTGQPIGGRDALTRATDALYEQEVSPANVYRQYLAGRGTEGLSAQGQRVREMQFAPTETSFRLANRDPLGTFREYLESGANLLNPDEMAQQFRFKAAEEQGLEAFDIEDYTPEQERRAMLLEQFSENKDVFRYAANPAIQRINPLFRQGATNLANRMFDRFQGQRPGQSFLQYLGGERGGRLFGF